MPPETPTPLPDTFGWFHVAMPPEAQWIFAFVGGIAFVIGLLAMPSILQMAFGGPKLTITHNSEPDEDTNALCFSFRIFNEPMGKALRTLWVERRVAEDVRASVTIRLHDGPIFYLRRMYIAQRIAANEATATPRITCVRPDGQAFYFDDDGQLQALSPGYYRIRIVVTVGEREYGYRRALKIGTKRSDSHWLN